MSPVARLARLVALAELPIVIAIAPAFLLPTPARLGVALACVAGVWCCVRVSGGPALPPTPMNAALLMLLGTVAVSAVATFDLGFSLGKIAGVLLGAVLFWAIARWLTTESRLRLAVGGFVAAGAALALIGLLGTGSSEKFAPLAWATARLPLVIRGVPGAEDGFNPNAVAGTLVLFLPLQVALLAGGAHRWLLPSQATRWATVSLLVIQAALLVLTAGTVLLMQSRGAWAALLVSAVAAMAWHSRRSRRVAIAVVVGLALLSVTIGRERLTGLVATRSSTDTEITLQGRVELWSRAVYGIQDFPFTGMGMNAFRRVMPVLYPSVALSSVRDVAHCHNHLLQAALDLGLPGLIAYLALWLVAGGLLAIVYRRSPDPGHRTLAEGLAAGLLAHFLFGMLDAIPLGAKVGVLFWLTLALTVGLHRVAVAGVRR